MGIDIQYYMRYSISIKQYYMTYNIIWIGYMMM